MTLRSDPLKLRPWLIAPYELLKHAEQHREGGDSFDMRMALISYDNAIELSIGTYLDLHPEQRFGRQFPRDQVDKWKHNYHSKLLFLEEYVTKALSQPMEVERPDIIHFHTIRNKLYHEGGSYVPHSANVAGIRRTALWVFNVLFNTDFEQLFINEELGESSEARDTQSLAPVAQLEELVLEIRKDFESLRAALAPSLQGFATNEQLIAKAVGTAEPEASGVFQEAFRKAETIATLIEEEHPVGLGAGEIDELNSLLARLKERLSIPLRQFQEQLAESAAKATVQAIKKGQKLVGNVHQPLHSGMSITMAAYLALMSQHSTLDGFSILVVADRVVLAEQYYMRLQDSLRIEDLQLLRLSPEIIIRELQAGRRFLGVGTIQSLKSATSSNSLPENTLVVAMGFDLFSRPQTDGLRNAFIISFSNAFKSAEPTHDQVIANYPYSRAVRDGYMVPAQLVQVHLQSLSKIDGEQLVLSQPVSSGDEALVAQAPQTLSARQMEAVATHIVEHFAASVGKASKALVIVSSVAEVEQMLDLLARALWSLSDNVPEMRAISVVALHSARAATDIAMDVRAFSDHKTQPSILVSVKMWADIDLTVIHCAYVTCQLSAASMRVLLEKLSSLRELAKPRQLVDYASNSFSQLYSSEEK
jgi:hypothetical protein